MNGENKLKSIGIIHNYKYFLSGFIIALKERLEYKFNFFSSFVSAITDLLLFLSFAYIISNNFSEDLNWYFIDFVVLYFFGNTIHHFSGIFWYSKQLNYRIKEGFFNSIFYLPGNKLLNHILFRGYNPIIHILVDSSLLYFIFKYTKFSFTSIIYSLLISLLLIYFFIVVFYFLDSFSWYFIEFGKVLSSDFLETINNDLLYYYPGSFFQTSSIKYVLMLVPMYFVSTIIVPVFQNQVVENLNLQLFLIIILSIIFTFGILINWHFGLKKYDAFG